MPQTFSERTQLDEQYFRMLVQMMQSHAYRELAAAQMFGYGLQFVPKIEWLKFITWHIREEMEHYEAVVRMYRSLTGESVEPIVNARLDQRPIAFAQSWYELAMAQFLYDRAGLWQLKEYEECSFLPYRKVIKKIIKEEHGHQSFGEKMLVMLTMGGEYDDVKQPLFERWLREGLLSFGRPGSDASGYAIGVGLKRRDSGAVMQDFINDVKPAVKVCGLTFPSMDEIRIATPAEGLDLSLDGVS